MTKTALPHWDMSVVYPGLDSPEFERDFRAFVRALDELEAQFDEARIDRMEQPLPAEIAAHLFDHFVPAYNALQEQAWTLGAYIYSFVTTDSRDEFAQARLSEMEKQGVRLAKLDTRLTAWAGTQEVESLLERSEVARAHAYWLRRSQIAAQHLMSPPEEALAAEMSLTGSHAWNKLYGNLTSQIMVEVELHGERQSMPMSMVRNLAFDPDRAVRRAGYEAELKAWEQHALPLASALNAIKGETNLMVRKRGWQSALEASLFRNALDEATLEAMLTAAYEAFPDLRRYLLAKARLLGIERCAWYDIFAPVGKEPRAWDYAQAVEFITDQFGTYSERLRQFAERAFRENWIDAEPRPGKHDGGFCMRLRRDESRILVNYKPSFGAVITLAHELGHAYHNLCLAERTYLQRQTPAILAETASIFCQTIILQAALQHADPEERLAILEASLQGVGHVVVDITSRYLFEKRLFEQRQERELSVRELCELMRTAQLETYGEGLDQNALHPYMWAAKPHYYGSTFYNYPYMFGLLFGLGLYALYQNDPHGFRARYDELLSRTGMADAAELAREFGFDIRTPTFWRSSFDVIRADIDQFEQLSVALPDSSDGSDPKQ